MHLVLGGTGGFGSAVVRAFLARGEAVRVLARSPETARLPPEVEVVRGDVTELRTVVDLAKGCDSITHAVNVPYAKWDPVLLHMTDNVVEAAGLTGATVVFPGTIHGLKPIYEVPLPVRTSPRDVNDRPCRKGDVRNQIEDQIRQNAEVRNIRTLIVRTGDMFGERIDNPFVGEMFRAALGGRPVPWFGSRTAGHAFTWSDDAARVAVEYALASDRPVLETVHVAGHLVADAETWGRALATAAGTAFGGVQVSRAWQVRLRGLLDAEMREFTELLYQWEAPILLDDSATRARLPHVAPTPLADALAATMAWFRT